MEWKYIVDLSQVLGSLALVLSVLLLLRELRENNRLTRAANNQELVTLASPFLMAIIQDRSVAELYVRARESFAELDEVDQQRYRSLLICWLIFHENVYYQRSQKLLDGRSFAPWAKDLKEFIRQQNLVMHWDEIRHLFQERFAEEVGRLIAEQEKRQSVLTRV